jgi:anti-sigma factor RsiW
MNLTDPTNGDSAEPPNRELDSLITRHLDGDLDAAEQRHLAERLAASPAARRTLAAYLRLEGATIRLASAGQIAKSGMQQDPTTAAEAVPEGPLMAARPELRRSRSMRRAAMVVAGGTLAAAIVGLLATGLPRNEPRREGELDLLASRWMELQRDPQRELQREQGGTDAEAVDAAADGDDPASAAAPPPRWLVAALADEDSNTASPDAS